MFIFLTQSTRTSVVLKNGLHKKTPGLAAAGGHNFYQLTHPILYKYFYSGSGAAGGDNFYQLTHPIFVCIKIDDVFTQILDVLGVVKIRTGRPNTEIFIKFPIGRTWIGFSNGPIKRPKMV